MSSLPVYLGMNPRGTSSTVVFQLPDNTRVQGVYASRTSLWETMFSLCPNALLHYRLKGKVRTYSLGDKVDKDATWEIPVVYVLPSRYHTLELQSTTTVGKQGTRVLARIMYEPTNVSFQSVVDIFKNGQNSVSAAMSAAASGMTQETSNVPVILSPGSLPSVHQNQISARTFLLTHLISIIPSWGLHAGLDKSQITQVFNTLIKIVSNFVTASSMKALHLRLGTGCSVQCDANNAQRQAFHGFPYIRQFFCILGMSFYIYNENGCAECILPGSILDQGPVDTTQDHQRKCITVPFADITGLSVKDSVKYITSLAYSAQEVVDKVDQLAQHGVAIMGPALGTVDAPTTDLVKKASWLMFQAPLMDVQFLKQIVSFLVQGVDSLEESMRDVKDSTIDNTVSVTNNANSNNNNSTMSDAISTSVDFREVKSSLNRFCRAFSMTSEDRAVRIRVLKALSRFVGRLVGNNTPSTIDIGKTSFMQSLGLLPDVQMALGCSYTSEPCTHTPETEVFFTEEVVQRGLIPFKWSPFRLIPGTNVTNGVFSIINRYIQFYESSPEELETFAICDRDTVIAQNFHTGVEFVEVDAAADAEKKRKKEAMLRAMLLGGSKGGKLGALSNVGSPSLTSPSVGEGSSDAGLISSVYLAKHESGPKIDNGTRVLTYDEVQTQQREHHTRFLTSVIKVHLDNQYAEGVFMAAESYKEVFHWINTLLKSTVDDDGVEWYPAFDLKLPPTTVIDYSHGQVKKNEQLPPPAAVVSLEPVLAESSSGRVETQQPRYVSIRDTPLGQRAQVHLQLKDCWIRGYPTFGMYYDSSVSNGIEAATKYADLPECNAPVGVIYINKQPVTPSMEYIKLRTDLPKQQTSVQVREPRLRMK